jgi:hypothetical protein
VTDQSQLDQHLDGLGLPCEMAARAALRSPDVSCLIADLDEQIDERNRRFIPGLLMAFVAMAEEVTRRTGSDNIDDVLEVFDYERVNSRGQQVNTLNLIMDDGSTVHLRPLYDAAEHVFIQSLRRYDYPNMAPHATQAWSQHRDMLIAVFAMTMEERKAVAEVVWERILELPEYDRRSSEGMSARPFALLLDENEFPGTKKASRLERPCRASRLRTPAPTLPA